MGKAYSIRPLVIYDSWGLNEVLSCWIDIEEEKYQTFKKQNDPKTLFIQKSENSQIDNKVANELFNLLDSIKK